MSTHEGTRRPVQQSRFGLNCGVIALLALFLGLTLLPAVGPSSAYGQAVPQVLGKTIGEWSAAWWQWVISIPNQTNPFLDTTGQFSGVGQRGPVWFLAGAPFGPDPVTRTSTVPAGKHILFPIVNIAWVKFPGDPPPNTEPEIRTVIEEFISPFGAMVPSTLDGVPTVFDHRTPTVRTQSPVFPVENVPQDNIFGVDIPAGSIGFSDGFWVMLPPLSPGTHVLRFATQPEVTYNLTALPQHR
jgi:hypothetical protein